MEIDGMCQIHIHTVYGSSNLFEMHFYFELRHSKFGKYVHRNREMQIKLNWIFRRCACANVCAILIWQQYNFADSPFLQILFHWKYLSAVPPMVWIQNQLVGSAFGQKIILECQSEAYPKSINYWMKNDTIITQGEVLRKSKSSEGSFVPANWI